VALLHATLQCMMLYHVVGSWRLMSYDKSVTHYH